MTTFIHIDSITKAHELLGLQPPKHPLVSIIPVEDVRHDFDFEDVRLTLGLYIVSLKEGMQCNFGYGRNSYDFTNGTMIFTKPGQVLTPENQGTSENPKGWMLLFHPDLIRKSQLGNSIENYSFFSYEIFEALHLSEEEKQTVTDLIHKIEAEFRQHIDKHSQKLIIATIGLLLDYCMRYYDRQFYVRTNLNQDYVSNFETLLSSYFQSSKPSELGLPTVKYCGEQLQMSSNYLSDLLKKETGKSAKDHINTFVVNRAKNKLMGSKASVSQIAYDLGFDYPQHFSTLFKKKTGISPAKYRTLN
ncbi:AraC family transcriptional regulator [Maribacter sp. ANRC-HE7]|uniref:AraC family transcriptional regulator n=1 Tax=Maribacter aquimaris TaxID=2737171 RepID=A0ABR7UXL9_9FLAO|nr:helix-turn-helix domain-containing protein [Maribacter aquimaris]MBD0776360.1 AraC family transcriptional regulator [Maribacter aquimaris]